MRVVDVAPQFRPDIAASELNDQENTKIIVFMGATGHGKSTQINAFLSFLLGGDLDDKLRLMVVDDRHRNQTSPMTQCITCYRVRPLSDLFEGKTILIVDTPGYGAGFDQDKFVTSAMTVFFKSIRYVNSVVLTCKANEILSSFLIQAASCVFSLFAKNVQDCLFTIYTHSDVLAPSSHKILEGIEWPVKNGEVEVNNAAFCALVGDAAEGIKREKDRDLWKLYMYGQHRVLTTLLRMQPVPTSESAQVSDYKMELEVKCEIAKKMIMRTENEIITFTDNLNSLARSISILKMLSHGLSYEEFEMTKVKCLEGVDSFLKLQKELCDLAEFTEKIAKSALNPKALTSYVDSQSPKKAFNIASRVLEKGKGAKLESEVLRAIVYEIRTKMKKTNSETFERTGLVIDLIQKLPKELLPVSDDPVYSKEMNTKITKLIQFVLRSFLERWGISQI